eukprot:Hpha_TRINITY_DN16425_c0_g5::TRINITY_DN16425_c0_g5_i1::g.159464::m.159464
MAKRLVVVGGSGFVGSGIAAAARQRGWAVTVVARGAARGGKRSAVQAMSTDGLPVTEYVSGDCFDTARWSDVFRDADRVVLSVGAFGSHKFMERVCGDANIAAATAALSVNPDLPRLCFISAACSFPFPLSAALRGYIAGKEKAEAALREMMDEERLMILRPGMVYGTRTAFGVGLPLQVVGAPLRMLLRPVHGVFGSDLLAPPVSVETLASAVLSESSGVLGPAAIETAARYA